MTLVRFTGARSLRDSLVSQLLGEWVASLPLARARWSEATDVGYPSLILTKQVEALKQHTPSLFPFRVYWAPHGPQCHKDGVPPPLRVHDPGGIDYTAAAGQTSRRPIPTRQAFLDTWKDMAKPLELRPPVNVDDPPASGRSWPVHSYGMPTRVPVGVGPNCPLGSSATANAAAHPPTRGLLGWPCVATKTWPLWPLFGPRTFRYLALLCRVECGLASFQSSSFKSEKLLKI